MVVGSAAGLLVLALTGCQGLYGVDLPGGVGGGPGSYRVTVEFADALDLVPQSAVKVGDVPVGTVESVTLDGWTARVQLRLQGSVRLPANARADIEQTSLLGEKFVALSAPEGLPAQGRLVDGAQIPLGRSGSNPEVEEVLGAMSLLLNGGGVAQLKTISVELDAALRGHELDWRSLVTRMRVVVGNLDDRRQDIVSALAALDRLSGTLAAQRAVLQHALDTLPGGLQALADQVPQLTRTLQDLQRLGAVGTRVIGAARDDTLADLAELRPILDRLSAAGDALPQALQVLLTYPFPDSTMAAVRGDYTDLAITADLDFRNLYANLVTGPQRPTLPPGSGSGSGGSGGGSGGPGLPGLPSVPAPLPSVPAPSGSGPVPIPLPTLLLGGAG